MAGKIANEQGSEAAAHWKAGREKLAKGDILGASLEEFRALTAANKHMQGPEAVLHWEAGQEHLKRGHPIDASIDEIKALSAGVSSLTNSGKKR